MKVIKVIDVKLCFAALVVLSNHPKILLECILESRELTNEVLGKLKVDVSSVSQCNIEINDLEKIVKENILNRMIEIICGEAGIFCDNVNPSDRLKDIIPILDEEFIMNLVIKITNEFDVSYLGNLDWEIATIEDLYFSIFEVSHESPSPLEVSENSPIDAE